MDELLLRVEADAETFGDADRARRFHADVSQRLLKVLGLRTQAEILPKGALPRTDFKARRVVDDRAVFRELHRQAADPDAP